MLRCAVATHAAPVHACPSRLPRWTLPSCTALSGQSPVEPTSDGTAPPPLPRQHAHRERLGFGMDEAAAGRSVDAAACLVPGYMPTHTTWLPTMHP